MLGVLVAVVHVVDVVAVLDRLVSAVSAMLGRMVSSRRDGARVFYSLTVSTRAPLWRRPCVKRNTPSGSIRITTAVAAHDDSLARW